MSYILITWLLAPIWWPMAAIRGIFCASPERILIAEIAGIGDVVCSTAVFKAVRTRYPQAHITLMVDSVVKDLAAQDANLDEIIPFDYGAQRGLKGRLRLMRLMREFDTVVCLIPSAAQLASMCWAAVPRRYTVLPDVATPSYQWLSPLMMHAIPHKSDSPFVGTQLRLLEPMGIQQDDLARHITVQESSRVLVHAYLTRPATRWIGLAIGSGQGIKAIKPSVLESLIQQLLQTDGLGVVLIGGGKEAALATDLAKAVNSDRVVNTAGSISLGDLPALIERLSVFVGVDSGVTYIADTLGIPLVYLPGPANPKDQRPIKAVAITLQKSLPCAPCSRVFVTPKDCAVGTHNCIASFSANELSAAVMCQLQEAGHG